jgi:hypothetical protein
MKWVGYVLTVLLRVLCELLPLARGPAGPAGLLVVVVRFELLETEPVRRG